jgi:hypothetical protein
LSIHLFFVTMASGWGDHSSKRGDVTIILDQRHIRDGRKKKARTDNMFPGGDVLTNHNIAEKDAVFSWRRETTNKPTERGAIHAFSTLNGQCHADWKSAGAMERNIKPVGVAQDNVTYMDLYTGTSSSTTAGAKIHGIATTFNTGGQKIEKFDHVMFRIPPNTSHRDDYQREDMMSAGTCFPQSQRPIKPQLVPYTHKNTVESQLIRIRQTFDTQNNKSESNIRPGIANFIQNGTLTAVLEDGQLGEMEEEAALVFLGLQKIVGGNAATVRNLFANPDAREGLRLLFRGAQMCERALIDGQIVGMALTDACPGEPVTLQLTPGR